jgi:hypothetical protein
VSKRTSLDAELHINRDLGAGAGPEADCEISSGRSGVRLESKLSQLPIPVPDYSSTL